MSILFGVVMSILLASLSSEEFGYAFIIIFLEEPPPYNWEHEWHDGQGPMTTAPTVVGTVRHARNSCAGLYASLEELTMLALIVSLGSSLKSVSW